MKTLNLQQKEAVETCGQPVLVIAGAGCGKTGVITQKIAYLINQLHYSSQTLAAITFTNKAAEEMKNRLKPMLSLAQTKNLTVSTFHSLGLSILKEHYAEANLKSNFSVIDAQDSFQVVKEFCQQAGIYEKPQTRNILWQISLLKNNCIYPNKALEKAETADETLVAKIYAQYQNRLESFQLVDFDDILLKPLKLLQQYPNVQKKWGQRFKHILIDEYQDTNICQYQLFKELLSDNAMFTAVGDDNQAVYEWRGANPKNLKFLQQDFNNLKVIALQQNYRSTNQILKVSNALINHNHSTITTQLWSNLGEGNAVSLRIFENAKDEAEKIIDQIHINRLIKKSKISDHCILYRGNFQAEIFEKILRQKGISYRLSGGISMFERMEIKNFIAYIKLMANPDDDVSFLRIINTPRREIGEKTIQTLIEYQNNKPESLLNLCQSFGLQGVMEEKSCKRLQYFAQWLNKTRDNLLNNLQQGLNTLIEDLDYNNWLAINANNPKTGELQQQRVEQFCQWIIRIKEKNQQFDLADLIQYLNLVDRFDDSQKQNNEKLNLMTIHAAKGLEFKFVYLIGLEEGTLPHHNSNQTEQGIIEERRLTYVAMTRAQEELNLSYCKKKITHKGTIELNPSRFLDEIPQENLHLGTIPTSKKENQQLKSEVLAQLSKIFEED